MFTSVAQANAAVIEQIRRARPHWLDVKPASSLISVLNQGKTLLHAGPPMRWQEMTGPMKGACIGACLFEGWAKDEMSALALLEQGKVNFIPAITLTPWGRWAVLPQPVCRCWSWKISPTAIAHLQSQRRDRQSDAFRRLWRGCSATFALDA